MRQAHRLTRPLSVMALIPLVLFSGQAWAGKATPMSADEIRKQLIGRTAIGIERQTETSIRLYFAPDGKLVANTHKGINEGSWKLDEQGGLCIDTGADKPCFRIIKKKKAYAALTNHESAKPKVLMTFRKVYSINLANHNRALKERNITLNRRSLNAIYKKVYPKAGKGTRIAVRNGYTESNWITASFKTAFGSEMVFHKDMKKWTDILVYILKAELKQRGFIIDDKAEKVITVRITGFKMDFYKLLGDFTVRTFKGIRNYVHRKTGQRYRANLRMGVWYSALDGTAANGVHYITKRPKLAAYNVTLRLEIKTGNQPKQMLIIRPRPKNTYKGALNFATCTAALAVFSYRSTQKYLGLTERPMVVGRVQTYVFPSTRFGLTPRKSIYFRVKLPHGPYIDKPCD